MVITHGATAQSGAARVLAHLVPTQIQQRVDRSFAQRRVHLSSLLRSARLLRQRLAHLRRVPQTAHRARGWRQTVTGAQQTAVAVIFEEHSRGKRSRQHAGGVEAERELMVLVDDRNRLDFGGEVKRELGGVI